MLRVVVYVNYLYIYIKQGSVRLKRTDVRGRRAGPNGEVSVLLTAALCESNSLVMPPRDHGARSSSHEESSSWPSSRVVSLVMALRMSTSCGLDSQADAQHPNGRGVPRVERDRRVSGAAGLGRERGPACNVSRRVAWPAIAQRDVRKVRASPGAAAGRRRTQGGY